MPDVAEAAQAAPATSESAEPAADLLLDALGGISPTTAPRRCRRCERRCSGFRTRTARPRTGCSCSGGVRSRRPRSGMTRAGTSLSRSTSSSPASSGALSELPSPSTRAPTSIVFWGELAAAASADRGGTSRSTRRRGPASRRRARRILAALRGATSDDAALILDDDARAERPARRRDRIDGHRLGARGPLQRPRQSTTRRSLPPRRRSTARPTAPRPHGALVELIEAAARDAVNRTRLARPPDGSRRSRQAAGTDWALGVDARSRALLSTGATAEQLYREALDRLGRCQMRVDLARTHLLYGEWLRRENRRVDARAQLHAAHDQFTSMGMEAFAERAARSSWPRARRCASGPSRRATI